MEKKLWRNNYSKKIMAVILTCALLISCVGIKTTAYAAGNYTTNTTKSSALKNKTKILFIGNSMTFCNNTPYLFQQMVGNNTVVNYIVCGSQSLYNHGEWIHEVLESEGIYKNFKKNLTAEDKKALNKKGSDGTYSLNDKKMLTWYNWYAGALFQNYTDETNTKKLTPISYDYVILQDRTDNMKKINNLGIIKPNAATSRDFYTDSWKGGLCRVVYELRNNGVTHGRTKYVINAVHTRLTPGSKLSTIEALQTTIDEQAVALKNYLANGFDVPGNKTFAMGSSDVKVAYTGDVVLSYLHDTKGKNITCTSNNVSTMVRTGKNDYKHPKLAASVMQAATIYRTIYGKQPPYLSLSSVPSVFNLSNCSAASAPGSDEYTFVKKNKETLYKYVQNYGTTKKAAWK